MHDEKDDAPSSESVKETPSAIVLAPPNSENLSREVARANPVMVYLASIGPNSRVTMRDALRRLVRIMGKDNGDPDRYAKLAWWRLQPEETTKIRKLLLDQFGVNTTKLSLAALRGVLEQCFRLRYIDGDTFLRLKSWPKVLGGDDELAGRLLRFDEVQRIRAACEAQGAFLASMDAAIFETGLGAGLRRDELARLLVTDLADDAKTLRVLGKRNKVRHFAPHPRVGGALETWLAQRARFPFAVKTMFVHVVGGRAADKSLSKWHVWDRLRMLGEAAKVQFTPHDLRRTHITLSLAKGGDVILTSQNVGHADPRTTARYDRRPFNARARVAYAVGELLANGWKDEDL